MHDVLMPKELLDRICCPLCGADLAPTAEPLGVTCAQGHAFGSGDGYLDLSDERPSDVETERMFASFGYEWNTFDGVRDEDARFAEMYFRDLDFSRLEGKVGLDAGCGKGRFTRFLAPHLQALIALDGSSAVQAAARNLREYPNVVVVKSDLRDAPLAPDSFGFVSCLGVLHHLEDPRAAFDRLVRLLAPGGTMLVYLYSRPEKPGARQAGVAAATGLRKLTVKMPHRALRTVSAPVALGLYAGFVKPGAFGEQRGIARLAALPMATYRGKPLRSLVLDTFDRLSAPIERRYLLSELEPWFASAGMVIDAARDEAGWFIVAHKP